MTEKNFNQKPRIRLAVHCHTPNLDTNNIFQPSNDDVTNGYRVTFHSIEAELQELLLLDNGLECLDLITF